MQTVKTVEPVYLNSIKTSALFVALKTHLKASLAKPLKSLLKSISTILLKDKKLSAVVKRCWFYSVLVALPLVSSSI